jgi:Cell division protein SepF
MGDGIQIAVVRPRNFRDGATIGEYFRQEIPVIINLEDMDNAEAERIIDFASGLILGLCGDIERLSRRTFLIVPSGATILTTHNALTEEGFFNQALPWIKGMISDDAAPSVGGGTAGETGSPPIDGRVAHQARVYDYLLGGCFHQTHYPHSLGAVHSVAT